MATAEVMIPEAVAPEQPDFRYRHLADITSALGGLWRRRLYTDLTLVADGKYVRCHRVVLASASSYFHTRLYSNKREKTMDKLIISDVPRDVLTDVLEFVYTGECKLTVDNAEDVLRASVIFQLGALRDLCDFFIKDHVHAKNALRLYKVSRATKSLRMEEKAREMILSNFMQLWHTKLFKQLSHRELISIIQRDDLVTPDEDVVCGAVLAWVNADKDHRKCVMGEILRHVRLPQVRQETLRQLVEEEEVVMEDEVCKELVQEALTLKDGPAELREVASPAVIPALTPALTPALIPASIPALIPRKETRLDEVLLMVGGVEAQGQRFRSRQRVHAFNLQLRKWFPLAPLPLGCDSGAACCVRGNDVFVSGGGESRQALVRYDSQKNQWHVLAPMLMGRRGHCIVSAGPLLYVVGGMTENQGSCNPPLSPRPRITATVECYDLRNNTWKGVGALTEPVWGASAILHNDKIHVFGGFHAKDRPTAVVQLFDPGSQSSRVTSQLPFPVALSRAVVSQGSVFIVGPSGNVITSRDCWRFKVACSIPDFQRALFGLTAHQGKLYVAGGRYGDRVHGEVLMLDIAHWTMVKMPEALPRPAWGAGFLKVTLDRAHMVQQGSEESDY